MFRNNLTSSLVRTARSRVGTTTGSLSFLRNLFIQTLETPNEQALKFVPSMKILGENETREFLSGREAACSPLAVKLFSIDGVKSIMYGSDFITVQKSKGIDWTLIKPEIFSILTEYLTNGTPILLEEEQITNDMMISEDDDEVVGMIKELIFTRIRPAIMDDGGDIEFVKFIPDNGKVLLKLKGACRSCESSSVTLRNGIESMLKYYIEEVQTVEAIDEEVVEEEEKPEPEFEAAAITPRARGNEPAPPSL
ncbi:uncharacterized protein SPAPADRAFT_59230 [Spathaspora passalidarum NRRL Y-27907]|uniref:Scaffold protein Nfu/NifU N-terminal domain-containing protein n=1 Tax=Spathaspora passalidarum (strain NRRL Y-27907 / 11-Y1) TaxID=619300 RepID=G3AJF7_SPAPN|nr:uncharacterized protein SPAPADRAFT_59230 [Spathaspora passalidarum NRRL Y-27907]EGW33860.1 hypothetical protein SPAPADRAFT_59230 [Spathaspora passalidarum NRRL Y-27907]